MKRFNIRRPREPNVETPEDDEKEKAGLHELWPGRADAAAKIETKLESGPDWSLNWRSLSFTVSLRFTD